jgi:hypothetical protein
MSGRIGWIALGLVGAAAFYLALGFRVGTPANPGSAVFPLSLSALIVVLAGIGLFSRTGEAAIMRWRPLAAVVASVAFFLLLVERLGLVPTAMLSMLLAYAGQEQGGYPTFVFGALVFAVVIWLMFSAGLGLPLQPLPRAW